MLGRLLKLALLAAIALAIGVAIFRPATFFGVDAQALANSLGGDVDHAQATCVGGTAGRWRCALSGEAVAGVEYTLTTHNYGCWTATRTALPASDRPVGRTISGCIGLADEFGS